MFKNDSKVTAIVAVYNGEDFIEKQLLSILNQTKSINKVIIRDDGSNDQTSSIIENFMHYHNLESSSWDFKVNTDNKGWRLNFMDMLSTCREGYVFFADQDDIWHENKVELMVRALDNNQKINVLVSDYHLFGQKGGKEKIKKINESSVHGNLYQVNKTLGNLQTKRDGCSFVVRADFIDSILNVYERVDKDAYGFAQAHDLATWLAGLLSNSLYHLHENLMDHRIHDTSAWSEEKTHIKQDRISNNKYLIDFYSKVQNIISTKDDELFITLTTKIKDLETEIDLLSSKSYLKSLSSRKKFSSFKRYVAFLKRLFF